MMHINYDEFSRVCNAMLAARLELTHRDLCVQAGFSQRVSHLAHAHSFYKLLKLGLADSPLIYSKKRGSRAHSSFQAA